MTFYCEIRGEYLKNDMFKNNYITNLKLGSLFDRIGASPFTSRYGITPVDK